MDRAILKDVLKLKLEMFDAFKEHLPAPARERLDSLEHKAVVMIAEAAKDYLEKKQPDEDKKGIKPVPIE